MKRSAPHPNRTLQSRKRQRMSKPSATQSMTTTTATTAVGPELANALSCVHIAVLHLEPYVQLLLLCLDAESIEAFLAFLVDCFQDAASSVLQDDALWASLLRVHFQTKASPVQVVPAGALPAAPCLRRMHSVHPGRPHRYSLIHSPVLAVAHAAAGTNADSAPISSSLAQFLAWTEARRWFDQRVVIIQGDSASAEDPVSDTHSFDDMVSDVYLRKKGVRALHVDAFEWRTADSEPEVRVQLPLGHGARHSIAICGRSTRVRSLIHFVRPSASALLTSWRALSRSFSAAMDAIQSEQLRSVAVLATASPASIHSTDHAAYAGLCELQQFVLREKTWRGTVGVVCYDKETFRAFCQQKERVLASFGACAERHHAAVR